jgi:hypothetical protein
MGEASHVITRSAQLYVRCFAHTMRYPGTRYIRFPFVDAMTNTMLSVNSGSVLFKLSVNRVCDCAVGCITIVEALYAKSYHNYT